MINKKINLIPSDLIVPTKVKAVKAFFVKVNLILSVILVISLLGAVGAYFYFSLELKKSTSAVADLKTIVTSLEKSEQKLILAKDKLSKISKLKKSKSIYENLSQVKNLTSAFLSSSDVGITEINIDHNKMEISAFSKTSNSLAFMFSKLVEVAGFKKVVLSSLGFNPSFGYTSEILFSN
ncbi:hypothetical protein A2130_00565 [Candidatus Woesebacteria bacterium GWC2_33_12]|uniref:Fimbrial assembly family protein n=1 Tax=Candidatus Woesebacteria bacterium GW2011_GWB1_33_22 TaxID=1618566 RepID=A0A0F9ZM46_9BACT|nr:MAG: hypothetical protein UR29_C0002G0004 [Candidatus Woesebacteria bacterium GW2011_GWC2_33_12]KKP42476.1 MAG: hypothetical protein UR33_C0002G0052 [Candidatus Woesebacteria bacterium GW2011_GWA2_33_20]KKP45219.1 MAG: hypothetical protein UR35_C0002G0052 [Candidatus Woesebacteria bacterium GW2011_GWB1_33_22]KKP46486.1 MAG: hypothetical protein UR37_C0007G0043 [Microgenomates group bacterium GW2011_GWC1_33_28]KKP50889.1 MAG: hypothetical protein UR41_C0002G0053 [Candidatus Woesebacteria bact